MTISMKRSSLLRILVLFIGFVVSVSKSSTARVSTDILDEKWDQIQKGQWLIGFFDAGTEESKKLEEDWEVFSLKCKEQDINAGKVSAPENPGLYVRFLVTVFPKVFYIKNGVAHEVKQPDRQTLMELIKNKKWETLKPVGFMSNPFSIQMSLLSHLFVHAVNLYNFEDAIVRKFVSFSSATDIAFGLTFIVVGTFLGILLTCAFGIFQVLFMDTKNSEDDEIDERSDEKASADDVVKEEDSQKTTEDSPAVRKRK